MRKKQSSSHFKSYHGAFAPVDSPSTSRAHKSFQALCWLILAASFSVNVYMTLEELTKDYSLIRMAGPQDNDRILEFLQSE
ncbi:MAG: hypothetical protein V4736_06810, partial [Bdellovibrionota bacterium]